MKTIRYTVRLVPVGWQHPKDKHGQFVRLDGFDYDEALQSWEGGLEMWILGGQRDDIAGLTFVPHNKPKTQSAYELEVGHRPEASRYAPSVDKHNRAFMVYRGDRLDIPTSPAFDTPFRLASWMEENYRDPSSHPFRFDDWKELCEEAIRIDEDTERWGNFDINHTNEKGEKS